MSTLIFNLFKLDKAVPIPYKHPHGLIAQLVEQATENRCVAGSNPARATILRSASFGWQAILL